MQIGQMLRSDKCLARFSSICKPVRLGLRPSITARRDLHRKKLFRMHLVTELMPRVMSGAEETNPCLTPHTSLLFAGSHNPW